tara:strand:+ start:2851 stop:3216 length:366 start_codon:yes stop_codon:yes gene_type:complete
LCLFIFRKNERIKNKNVNIKIEKMIKKTIKMLSIGFAASVLLSSCYSYTSVVGKGAQGNNETTKWNHYVIYGLAPVGVSDSKQMANGAEDYTIFTRQSFVNGLVSAITFGIYSPTTTTVTK